MKPSKVLLISVFITALILVVIGGVTSAAMANKTTGVENVETVQTYQQREAEYIQLVEQANQQLAEANARLQAMQEQVRQSQPAAPESASAPIFAVSADKAEKIARTAADPKYILEKKPELVSFEGKAAYEVAFQGGSIYVDAQTGDVLFNGTVPQEITAEKAAQIASDYLKNKDILLVDQITFRGAPLYRVIFKNGMMVYLDTTGQITYILKSSPKPAENQFADSGGSSGPSYSVHEQEHDDHGHDDD